MGDELSLHVVRSLQSSVCILYPVCTLRSAVCSLHFVHTEFPTRSENFRKVLVLFVDLRAFGCGLSSILDKIKCNDYAASPPNQ